MYYNHLSIVEFLLYLELLFGLVILVRVLIITPLFLLLESILNLPPYRADAINLYLNIPFSFVEIILFKSLVHENSINSSIYVRMSFYIGGLLILIVNHLLHQKGVYKLAIKERSFLLKYSAWRFFKLVFWLYPSFLILNLFINFDYTYGLSLRIFDLIDWFYGLRYFGFILPLISLMLLIGSFIYALFFLFNYRKMKIAFYEDFSNDM